MVSTKETAFNKMNVWDSIACKTAAGIQFVCWNAVRLERSRSVANRSYGKQRR